MIQPNGSSTHSWIRIITMSSSFTTRFYSACLEVSCFEIKLAVVALLQAFLQLNHLQNHEILHLLSFPCKFMLILSYKWSPKHLTHLSVDCVIIVMLLVTCTVHCIHTDICRSFLNGNPLWLLLFIKANCNPSYMDITVDVSHPTWWPVF